VCIPTRNHKHQAHGDAAGFPVAFGTINVNAPPHCFPPGLIQICSDQREDYRERGESRARAQHDVLVKSLEKVAGEADGENEGWKVKLIIFVGGTRGSVHVQTFNNNLKELGVIESKRNTIREGFVHELLNAQDTVLCSYFAQRSE
jgi:hypothetical protein